MIGKVQQFIKKHTLFSPNSTVIVGVSGGPDSLALLHFLNEESERRGLTLIAAHVDHMFRGKESEDDLKFVEAFCRSIDIRCESIQIDVTAYQQKKKLTSQVAARECRYNFFADMMEKYNADTLALAHHGDDQVETILMKLTRGSTMNGYAGIQAKRPFHRGEIVRPLLSVTKQDLIKYCENVGLEPRLDPSNEKTTYTRNRFRHYILPHLKAENPEVHERFQAFSENLSEDQKYLEELTVAEMNTVMKKKGDQGILIDIEEFQKKRKPLQRRGIQLILNYLYTEIPPTLSSANVGDLLALFKSDHPSGRLHLPGGLQAIRSYNECLLTFEEKKDQSYSYHLTVPGQLTLPNGRKLICSIHNQHPIAVKGNDIFLLDERYIGETLTIRSRNLGDKLKIKGMKGTKKVKDIFIDAKVPLSERSVWPIVEDRDGTILWIPGLKKSSYELNTYQQQKYVILYYK
ncbi:tRNA lysidine(34) synthetase TilS [Priestia koreensis]|uniref:tRNA lysidine(34) synthetase TilS n=1 Tax=Priestia koreensis TaxID=284581 RepID=UPI001F57311A|nr:tRNA lysidine(34) synthetase TilS [Priestia koreensis]MCM3006925.1 tRNA lysidine(34) synthetase TilS [Priestia koreensis]UNL85092.1 tRNA lysidine(34) synthetase TilS [Priestia koreensis]